MMTLAPPSPSTYDLAIDIGGMPILVRTESAEFARLLEHRYQSFARSLAGREQISKGRSARAQELSADILPPAGVAPRGAAPDVDFTLDVELVPPGKVTDADQVRVRVEAGRWIMERGDFHAEWDPASRHGRVRQSLNRYSIDGVLRILHSLILSRQGGFLVHAASAVRGGRAFVFAGVSGTGKTTIAGLAPPDVTLLTDEISYVRPRDRSQEPEVASLMSNVRTRGSETPAPGYLAYGTPFAGELARLGEKVCAPLAALFLLKQGPENRIEALRDAPAARELMRHILFFAHDAELVQRVFHAVCDFVRQVPVRRLVFKRDASVWELIG